MIFYVIMGPLRRNLTKTLNPKPYLTTERMSDFAPERRLITRNLEPPGIRRGSMLTV